MLSDQTKSFGQPFGTVLVTQQCVSKAHVICELKATAEAEVCQRERSEAVFSIRLSERGQ